MSDVDFLRSVKLDEHVLNTAAASMYQIREPKGSKRTSFDNLAPGKKARNRELAVQTLRAVFERYPDPASISNPDEIKMFLAEQMYRTLAPRKSESFPFDQRTPFARSYYQEQAESFLRNFLLPLVEQHQPRPVVRDIQATTSGELSAERSSKPPLSSGPASAQQSLPVTKPVPSLGSGFSRSTGRQSGSISSVTVTSTQPERKSSKPVGGKGASAKTGTQRAGSHAEQGNSEVSNAAAMIGCLLVVIIVLLVILVIRTF